MGEEKELTNFTGNEGKQVWWCTPLVQDLGGRGT